MPDIDMALDLQDCLANMGGTILTACRLKRAVELAQYADLMCVVVERSIYRENFVLRNCLSDGSIPHVIFRGSEPVESVASELISLVQNNIGAERTSGAG